MIGLLIPGFKLHKVVHENLERTLLMGTNEVTNEPVLIKLSKGKIKHREQLARYKREQSIIKRLELDVMATPLDILNVKGSPIMVFKSFGDGLLNDLPKGEPLGVEDFLHIAINFVKAVTELHFKRVTHSRLTPESVLVKWKTKEVRLLDLETASMLDNEVPGVVNFNDLGSEIAYIAPEQSGRMNRKVDSRSNLYSVGCIFYEMLTNAKVFEYRSVVDLVYSHLAKNPEPPSKHNIAIPAIIDNIILKLLNKNAEDRYQSAFGLSIDLENCLKQYEEDKKIDTFKLGEYDLSNTFSFPQKLYGREIEVEKLLNTFNYVAEGNFCLLMITGYSGIGKTTLINELHKSILSKDGYFVTGKYDQLEKNNPFYALTSGLKELINLILSDPIAAAEIQIEKIVESLSGQGKLLIEVLPNLELLIGEQPEVPILPIAESENRFLDVLCRFVGSFASAGKPLTIFVDDLQWADLSTLKFLEKLCAYKYNKNILVIGAYRDNEVSSTDPLLVTLTDIKESGIFIEQIKIKQLSEENVNELVADSLKTDKSKTVELSRIISKQTGSNPFFLKFFMLSLSENNFLWFDAISSEWKWDIEKIKSAEVTSNVIDLMVHKLLKTPHESLELLKVAACIGNRFDLLQLKYSTELAPSTIAHHLWQPLSNSIINPCDESYKTAEEEVEDGYYLNAEYKFAHDRIQQATYGLISEAERKSIHLQIGIRLFANLTPAELDEKLFSVVNHFNAALDIISDNTLKADICALNLKAAQKAKDAAAFSMAAHYYSTGIKLFPNDAWLNSHEETAIAHTDLAECQYICGNYQEADLLYSLLLSKTKKPKLIARVYDIRLRQYAQQGRNKETLDLGAEILKTYGISFKSEPSLLFLAPKLIMAKISLIGKDPSKFTELPKITDEKKSFALQTLMNLSATAYVYDINTMLLLVLRMLKISIKYGNGAESAFGYGLYGFVEGAALGNAEQSKKFADLSVELCKNLTDPIVVAKVAFLRAFSTQHWFEPIKLAIQPLKEAFKVLDQSGSYTFASYCLQATMAKRLYLGETFETYYDSIVEYSLYTEKVQEIYSQNLLFVLRRFTTKFTGHFNPVYQKDIDKVDEAVYVKELTEKRLLMPVAWFYVYEMIYHFHFGNWDETTNYLKKGELVDKVAPTTMAQIEYHFYSVIILSRMVPSVSFVKKKVLILKAKSSLKKLKKWSMSSKENFESRYLLAQAVLNSHTTKNQIEIENYFYQSLQLSISQNNGFLQGLVNELWSEYLFSNGNSKLAGGKLSAAISSYSLNGASQKVLYLKECHGFEIIDTKSESDTTETSTLSEIIDFEAVLKSSRVISGEIVLEKLLSNLLNILIENVGGQRGFLILVDNNTLTIESKKEYNSDSTEIIESYPLERSNELSKMIVYYVWQTGESILIDDALLSTQFQRDEYLTKNEVRSVLCVPIINHGDTVAIMYVENNSAACVFTKERLHLTEILTSQAAISIENAKLYNTLEQKVLDRTEQLNEEKKKSDNLLKNILPSEIITELHENGVVNAKLFEQATVLFSDFKDFTKICQLLSPTELVELIDLYFSSFDDIMTKYKIEKIKTVGDAYLAAGGLPIPSKGDPKTVVKAAIEMMDVVNKIRDEHKEIGKQFFEIRIGIHTGPVIAGIVGKSKFAYDIWGDSVNIAARMEQNGEPGKINVSGSTHSLIKDEYSCLHRGKIQAKNKGEIDMYFVEY